MRQMMMATVIAALAVLIAVAAPRAQTTSGFEHVALTGDLAGRALDALPAVYAVAQSYEDQFPDGASDDVLVGLSGLATYEAARLELDGAVAPHGFSGYMDWVATIQTVLHAYAYVQSRPAMEQMAPQMDAAMQQILNNPNIPQAQKDAIMAQIGAMGGARAAMEANAPTPENQAVVRELGPRIEEAVNAIR